MAARLMAVQVTAVRVTAARPVARPAAAPAREVELVAARAEARLPHQTSP
jgi:hypothetical protein